MNPFMWWAVAMLCIGIGLGALLDRLITWLLAHPSTVKHEATLYSFPRSLPEPRRGSQLKLVTWRRPSSLSLYDHEREGL